MAELHRVRTLRWQARAGDAAAAFALRHALHERSDALEAALARAFDRVAPPGEVWRLPRLELQLQLDGADALDESFDARLEEALVQALRAARPAAGAPGRLDRARDDEQPTETGQVVPAAEAAREALRSYLASGLLPWAWQGAGPPTALQEAAQEAALAALADVALREALLPPGGFSARLGALLRWIALIDAGLRRRWVESHRPQAPLGSLGSPRAAWADGSAQGHDSLLEWQAAWLAWPDDAAPAPAADDRRALQRWLAQRRTGPAGDTRVDGMLAAVGDVSPETLIERRADTPPDTAAAAAPTDPSSPSPRTPPPTTADSAPALLVPLAGLVLLHPYLPRLLAGCGVIEPGARAIPDAQLPRGLALLHALACGPIEAAEHRLPLAKLLLGRDPAEPLSAALPALNEAEQDEVDAVLAACREHWSALRGSGDDTLRLSFLQRRGLLTRADGAWQLRLQGEAFDVLLGLLPWSIGIVRLPWMPQPLFVDWPPP